MKFDEDNLIEKYLNKSINEEELLLFQKRMAQDPIFFDRVKLEEQLYDSLDDRDWSIVTSKDYEELEEYKVIFQNEATKKIKENIQEGYEFYKKDNRLKKRKQFLYSCAAAVIFFVVIFSLLQPQPTNTELYSSYIDFSELPTLSTRSEENKGRLLEAERLFENKEYSRVVEILTNDPNKAQESLATRHLYLGISYMELDQFDQAQRTFEDLNNSDLIDGEMAIWYKALLYIKKNDISNAKETLQQITSDKLYNHKKAINLLDKLD